VKVRARVRAKFKLRVMFRNVVISFTSSQCRHTSVHTGYTLFRYLSAALGGGQVGSDMRHLACSARAWSAHRSRHGRGMAMVRWSCGSRACGRHGGRAVGESGRNELCYNICPPGAFPCDPWQHKGHVPLYLLRLCTPSVRHRVADVRAQHVLSAAARSRRRDGHALVQQRACTVLHL